MKRPLATVIFILSLSTIIGMESYFIYQDIVSPKPVRFDDKIETPKLLETKDLNPTISPTEKNKTRALPRSEGKFLKVTDTESERFQYSKDEYLSKVKTKKSNNPNLVTNWEKKILNPETNIEKSLAEASKNIRVYEGHINGTPTALPNKDMERFAIKIELPEMNEGTKFTLQYREPPDFGRNQIPEAAFQPQRPPTNSGFSIEKTKAYDSPWDNFSGSKSNP